MQIILHKLEKGGKTLYRIFNPGIETYGSQEMTAEDLDKYLLYCALSSAISGHRRREELQPLAKTAKRVKSWPESVKKDDKVPENEPATNPFMIEFFLTERLAKVATDAIMAELAKLRK